MLEVCFDISMKGSLRYIASFLKSNDIVCFPLCLSQGDIQSSITKKKCLRFDYIHEILSFDSISEDKIDLYWQRIMDDLKKMMSYKKAIRVWVDSSSNAQCGWLFLVHLLQKSSIPLYVVELTNKRNDRREYKGWGEVEPHEIMNYLAQERLVNSKEKMELARQWHCLQKENAPLRVIQNGKVKSVGLDYYDFIIDQYLPTQPCRICEIIALILSDKRITESDFFIAQRLKAFIEKQTLILIEKKYRFYECVVVKNRTRR